MFSNQLDCPMIDGAYVNSLVNLVNACRAYNINISEVHFFQNGWHVTFEGYKDADAICHDYSYNSPFYMRRFFNYPENDWSRVGDWETIGFPWDENDVSVHSAEKLAYYLYCLKIGEAPWLDIEK